MMVLTDAQAAALAELELLATEARVRRLEERAAAARRLGRHFEAADYERAAERSRNRPVPSSNASRCALWRNRTARVTT